MRYTYGTIAAITCAILVLATFWPQPEGPVMQNVVAQSEPKEATEAADPTSAAEHSVTEAQEARKQDILEIDPEHPFQGNRERIEAILAEPYEVEFFQMPLREILTDISVNKRIPFYIEPGLRNGVFDPDHPIDLQFRGSAISLRTLLDMLLLEMGNSETVGYTVRDNILVFAEKHKTTQVVVYNCRDLLMPTPPAGPVQAPDGQGDTAASGGGAMTVPTQFGFAPGPDPGASAAAEQQLIQVISNTVASGTWEVAGVINTSGLAVGSIDAINGLIVVKHTREVQEQVKNLLTLLREARQEHGLDGTIYSYPRPVGGLGGGGGGGFGGGFGGGGGGAF